MTLPFALLHALREGRSGARRIGWFLGTVSMGVAVLVALYGFQRDAAESARTEARTILGGDLRIESAAPFPAAVSEALDAAEATVARGITLASIVYAPGSGVARLLQVNGVDGGFPASGPAVGDPADVPLRLTRGGGIAADPQVLLQLGVVRGDTVRIGNAWLEVLGSVRDVPVDVELQWAVGPPIFAALQDVERAGILGFGSIARHRAWLVFSQAADAERFARRHRGLFRESAISVRTAEQEADALEAGFEELARFLSLVGLAALILGGIGVGSAVNVYLRERRASIAVLRCLGARRGTVFRAYLLQTTGLGLGGAIAGAVAGAGIQKALPVLLGSVLPFGLQATIRPEGLALGVLLGTWVAVSFSLLPLVRAHAVSPLSALRAPNDAEGRGALWLTGALGAVVAAGVLGVAWLQLGRLLPAAVVTASLLLVLAGLAVVAWGLARAAKALVPAGAPFPLRQGLAGLFRPGNQTLAVVAAIGLGAFLIGALLVVEDGLRSELAIGSGEDEPSLVLFDIQSDQQSGVAALLRREGLDDDMVPIVPARLAEIRGRPAERAVGGRGSWAVRRLYRNTWRPELGSAEALVAGTWWGEAGEDPRVTEAVAGGAARVSLERELAEELGVEIGDEVGWDVQGVPVASVVSSLREVEWGSFQPNFFAIFEPGALDGAPSTFVALVRAPDPATRERVQSAVLAGFPNVSFLDVAFVRATIERIAGRVTLVLRSMGGFILAGGGLVLLASLLATRFERRRESALLKTLGASARTIRGVLLAEYAAIGAAAGAAGLGLAALGGRFLLRWQFDLVASPPWTTLLGLWMGVLALAVAVGWSVSGPVLRATPISVLRDEGA